jgi:hypothetical protein
VRSRPEILIKSKSAVEDAADWLNECDRRGKNCVVAKARLVALCLEHLMIGGRDGRDAINCRKR